ncbi:MAG: hypothetical protein KDE27_08690 [Planctomycetes bacterium]|nr:hypothetical protein [Planctomycetota bacterium]
MARGPAGLVALLASALASGCVGIFQRPMPATVPSYAIEVAASAAGALRVGSAERDVTPAVGGYLAGFNLGRRSTGVASPLKVRALVLELGDRPFAIVGIDNLGMLREDVDWVKRGVAGFRNGDICVCASHTHAGPDLIGLWGFYLWTSGRDPDYLAAVRAATAAAIAEARQNAVPAEFAVGRALLPPEGLVRNSNRGGVFDRRLVVLQARARDDGRPVGTLLHMACHPEVMRRRNTEICADFVGELCDEWRARGHGQAVFVNGALGAMISPAIERGDLQGVVEFGRGACDVAERALAVAEPLAVDAVEVRRRDVFLPMDAIGFRLGRMTGALPREVFDDKARSTVGFLRIGGFRAALVPGEMEPALAERVRAELGMPELVMFGLCDDEVGYLLRAQEARDPEFAYERSMSPCLLAGEIVCAELTGQQRAGAR